MLYAITRNKAGLNFSNDELSWRKMFKASEDSLTSSVFERLFYLPTELFWKIVTEACYSNDLPQFCGPVKNKEFWPRWDSDGTPNRRLVEPDLFIEFENFDLIIEAKRYDDRQQIREQWEAELQAYQNEYGDKKRKVYLIALGGLYNTDSEVIEIENVGDYTVIKCRWMRILTEIQKALEQLSSSEGYLNNLDATVAILQDLISAFQVHGFVRGQWFDNFNIEGVEIVNYDLSTSVFEQFQPEKFKK